MYSKRCKNCEKEFTLSISSKNEVEKRGKFCSQNCYNDFKRKNPLLYSGGRFQKGHKLCVGRIGIRGEKNNKWRGGPITKNCEICFSEFTVTRDRENQRFCSIVCRKKWEATPASRLAKSEMMRRRVALGLHNLYRGITELKALLRQTSRYKQWRESVFIRDGFKCQFCGAIGEINADHIKPFAVILVENNVRTFEDAMNCFELWNMENGQTLCVLCHKKTETYGRFVHAFINKQKVEIIKTITKI